ncbi:winged helix-turn-helix domain-containing protein [Methanobrevibacter sp.]|uniref:helix-turn-helix domain-containing protein n=1 Tax=Methanobrevibacter sp. TaxID=66852 RepID=UPI0038676FBB
MSEKKDINIEILNLSNRDLSNILIGRKGGKTTIKIIDKLLIKPYNANQLSNLLELDYKTILHHINIAHEHKYVDKEKTKNSNLYYPSNKLINCLDEYYLIKEFLLNEK